jgi:hypothetical protein
MKRLAGPLLAIMVFGFLMLGWDAPAARAAADPPKMSIDELKGMLDSKDLVVLDVRAGKDWSSSELKIKGAVREDPKALDSWAGKYPKDKKIILYCA